MQSWERPSKGRCCAVTPGAAPGKALLTNTNSRKLAKAALERSQLAATRLTWRSRGAALL